MKKFLTKKYLIPLAVIVVMASWIYYCGVYYFGTRFFPGTVIGGGDVSLYSLEDAEKKVREISEINSINIIGRTGTEEMDLSGADVRRVFPEPDEILKGQDPFKWPLCLSGEKIYGESFEIAYNDAEVDNAVSAFMDQHADEYYNPENAYISYDEKTSRYIIVPETEGNRINIAKLKKSVKAAIAGDTDFVDLEDAGVYFAAAVRSDNSSLNERLAFLNEVNSRSISIDMGAETILSLDGRDIIDFLGSDDNVDSLKVAEYISELAQSYNTYDTSVKREITNHNGEIRSIKAYYGWELDEAKTESALNEILEMIMAGVDGDEDSATDNGELSDESAPDDGISGDDEVSDEIPEDQYTLTAVWKNKGASHEDPDYGTTYVEVDMGEQNVYVYVDGELVLETPCVTGKMSGGRATPEGLYSIKYKETNKTLTGYNPDGSIDYASFVNYWMPFNGGVGLHDATWRGSFGGSIYVYSGSHGCVNLPKSAAKTLFNICYAGMPVICYY